MNVPRLIFPPLATFCRAASAALSSTAALTNYVFCSSFGQASDGNDEFKELGGHAVLAMRPPIWTSRDAGHSSSPGSSRSTRFGPALGANSHSRVYAHQVESR